MKVYRHPDGLVLTLDPQEQFLAHDQAGPVRVSTVTTFTRGDGLGPYWTGAGTDKQGGFRELDARFRDVGLLPPHLREAARTVPMLDFPANVADTGLSAVRAVQEGRLPQTAVDELPLHTQTAGLASRPKKRTPGFGPWRP